jgi:hypothetical protein
VADPLNQLLTLLEQLEDELPYVTVDDVCARWEPTAEAAVCQALITESIADRRLFTDLRHRLDHDSISYHPVRLIRLNRRHPEIAALLD